MEKLLRVLLVAVTAPAISAILFPTFSLAGLLITKNTGMVFLAGVKLWIVLWVFAFVVGLVHMVVLGLPIYFLFERFNLMKWWTMAAAGFLAGAIPMNYLTIARELRANSFSIDKIYPSILIFGASGMLAGYTTWLMLRQKMATNNASSYPHPR